MSATSHVLLIEDDEPLSGILSAYLRARGYDVTVSPTAEAARSALSAGLRPDIVLLDINLPGETGWSVVRSDALAAAGDPPVVVASAMAISPDRLREFGVAGYLPKPFALETLRTDHRPPALSGERRMTDLQILLIALVCVAGFGGYVVLVDRLGPMNLIELADRRCRSSSCSAISFGRSCVRRISDRAHLGSPDTRRVPRRGRP